jgi:hypothetical protein
MRFAALLVGALAVSFVACDTSDRLARLEKQNQELQAQVQKGNAAADLDLQAKCSRDARAWFTENWLPRDKDTILLDFTNHYNKKLNKCFILVEYHYDSKFAGAGGTSWTNDMLLTDVYENSKYGRFDENHYTYWKPTVTTNDEVISCELLDQKCKTIEEFNGLLRPYMND